MGAAGGQDQLIQPDGFALVVEPSVLSGVAVRSSRPDEDAVVAMLRHGVERVIQQCMGVELTWRTAVAVRSDEDDVCSWDEARDGLDWDHVLGRGEPLVRVTVWAVVSVLEDQWWEPKRHPVTAIATFQGDGIEGRSEPVRDTAVRLSMHRWAMYGSGADLVRVAEFVEPWLLGAADRLSADTGYVTLDRHHADYEDSPWERATQSAPWKRDVTRTLWGHGWGTLLSPVHVDAVGGRPALEALREAVPLAQVRDVDGRTWVTLGPDPGAVRPQDIAALRRVLLPALPRGARTVEEFERAVARGEATERLIV